MSKRKNYVYKCDHFMTSKEVGESLIQMSKIRFDLAICISSGGSDQQISQIARKLNKLPSDPCVIAGNFFKLMHELSNNEKDVS